MQRPWLLAVVAALAVAGHVARAALLARHDARRREHARLIWINPPPEVDPDGARVLWSTLAEILRPTGRRRLRDSRAHVALEYRWSGRQLRIGLWLPDTIAYGPVLAAIRGAWPGIACNIADPSDPVPATAIAEGGALIPVLPAWFPLESDHDADPLRTLIQAAAELGRTEAACVQVLARPASNRQIRRLRRGVQALRTGKPPTSWLDPAVWLRGVLDVALSVLGPTRRTTPTAGRSAARLPGADPQADRDARAAVDKLAGTPLWDVAVRYAVAHTGPGGTAKTLAPRLTSIAQGLASSFGVYAGRNRLRRIRIRTGYPGRVLASRVLRSGFVLNAGELSTLAGLPTDIAVPGLDRARAKAMPAPVAVVSGGRGTKVLGTAQVGGHKVALKAADARQHAHVIGSTGSGKSTLLTHMILDDIHARRGVIVIDPKGDLINDVIDRLPADVADKRLYLIDPDQPAGATLNPLEGADHDLVVDHIVSIFGKIFAKHWGPRIDDTMRMACLTLLRKANATLTLIPSLLQDKQFRAAFTSDLDDPEGLLGFWQWFESTPPPLRSQVIGPVLARLRSFLTRPFVTQTVGAARSTVDMRRVLDGGILLARLPKGQIGEETARLMGSFILAQAWQTATGRTRIAEDARRDAVAYIDESHNFLNLPGSVGDMLAEARGYRFGLVLAHQNLTQMPRETQLALSANARNKVFFTCAPEDATQLAKHTMPELSDHDLSHLDAFQAAARLVVDGRETPAFTLHTLPPKPPVGETTAVRQAALANVTPDSGNGQAAIAKLARMKPPGRKRRPEPPDDPTPTETSAA
ncbi:type IV secretion system DNA-binding domain-containing protein [Wangella sp. NEAU-J3]|nr:type IV secretion system DNA-binding domain-containing protein [Jidongwangia harbinensis]MCA2216354.1 type IV secretion system DNA-binding domain-containing protein [Jidongwangia harbinensis]MCA2217089.1 type IV secretion system DNA-binding domain-containing protein [Jidongwangia harbinensis]